MDHVSDVLSDLRDELSQNRDSEIAMAHECAVQYITDHNDTAAYRSAERKVAKLAQSWDKLIAKLEKWEAEARKIEDTCENFYGD